MAAANVRKEWRDPRITEFDVTIGMPTERVHLFVDEADGQLKLQVIVTDSEVGMKTLTVKLTSEQAKQLATAATAGEYQAWLRRGT